MADAPKPKIKLSPDEMLAETLARTRRIETRLTKFIQRTGGEPPVDQCTFVQDRDIRNHAVVRVPSRDVPLQEILSVVPSGWRGEVQIYIGDDRICTILIY